jgi:lysophospholipase L1-like esterase
MAVYGSLFRILADIGRADLTLLARVVAIALFTFPAGALAQTGPNPTPPASEGCIAVDPNAMKDFAPFTEAMLTPGKSINIADVIKSMSPEMLARMGALQKQAAERQAKDFAYLCRYAEENAAVLSSGVRPRVVFLGDSITENWKMGDPTLFGPSVLDRGISGQTTPQILLRFYQDVVALHPRVVHIMAGTNDISGNTGPATDQAIVNNIRAMIDIAKAHGIRVVLASITPSKGFAMRPGFDPSPRIAAVNRMLVSLAAEMHVTYVDYFPLLVDSQGGFKAALANDGLHPNREGYAVMRPLTDNAIARAVK